MSFHNILFPSCLEMYLVGKSAFSTSRITSSSGREIRSLDHEYSKGHFLLKDCCLSKADFTIFNNFFKARRGSRFAFLLKDFTDFSVTKQRLGVGNGVRKEFQLYKTYEDERDPYIRKISKVKREGFLAYADDDQLPTEGQNYQINENIGIITLENPLREDSVLYASFEFYLTVRFNEDSFDYEQRSDGTIQILNVSLIEVLE